jgi:hypothetical protein
MKARINSLVFAFFIVHYVFCVGSEVKCCALVLWMTVIEVHVYVGVEWGPSKVVMQEISPTFTFEYILCEELQWLGYGADNIGVWFVSGREREYNFPRSAHTGIGALQDWSCWGVKFTSHFYPLSMLRVTGATFPLLHIPLRRAQVQLGTLLGVDKFVLLTVHHSKSVQWNQVVKFLFSLLTLSLPN